MRGTVSVANNAASADRRTEGASSLLSTRRARRTVHSTRGLGHTIPFRVQAARRNPMSNGALCATRTAPAANSRKLGSTVRIGVASRNIAVVMPVSSVICGGTPRPGSIKVASSPITSPPRTLTAPISVMPSSSDRPPVVSRSTTTKVMSRSAEPSSSKLS